MSQKMQIDRGRCAGLRIYKFLNFYNRILHSHLVWQNPNPSPFFFRFFSNVSPKLLCCRFFQSACLSTGATLLKLFFSSFFRFFFFFAFRRFWPFRLFSAFLGLSRPFSASSRFWAKWEPFRASSSQFFTRDMVTFSGAEKRMWFSLLEELLTPTLHSNIFKPTFSQCLLLISPQHFQANIFTMPSSQSQQRQTAVLLLCLHRLFLARTTSTIHPTKDLKILSPESKLL